MLLMNPQRIKDNDAANLNLEPYHEKRIQLNMQQTWQKNVLYGI
jgi:hypothetical protein